MANADFTYQLLDLSRLPQHIAVIMDGNGRWANEKGLERLHGHAQGVESVRTLTKACVQLGIPYLTLYSFSTENWNRPEEEVTHLMNLLAESIEKEFDTLHQNNIQLRVIGDLRQLPLATQEKINWVSTKTKDHQKLTLTMALNYSSRWEIIHAVNQILSAVDAQKQSTPIHEDTFRQYLSTKSIPDPELLIRTGGEQRISNFLLYQMAYTELYFTNTYWPDFAEQDLELAIADFQKRERRFGKTSAQVRSKE